MFTVDIDGLRVLYTGDYSRIPDRHLPGADLPPLQPNIGRFQNAFSKGVLRSSDRGKHVWRHESSSKTTKRAQFLEESSQHFGTRRKCVVARRGFG